MPVTCPCVIWNPTGVFIQEFALTINHAEAAPLIQRGKEQSQCARGERRSHPYRERPRKIASMKKAKPSRANGKPMIAPENLVKVGQSRPISNERIVPETAPMAKSRAKAFVQRRMRVLPPPSFLPRTRPPASDRRDGTPPP